MYKKLQKYNNREKNDTTSDTEGNLMVYVDSNSFLYTEKKKTKEIKKNKKKFPNLKKTFYIQLGIERTFYIK